jgi:hypothetical protein
MRYQETGELHLDFHGAVNTTIQYIAKRFGQVALREIFDHVGKDVYKSIHEGLANDDPRELKEHLDYFFRRENGEFELRDTTDGFVLEVSKCPAVEHVRKLGLELSPGFCRQTTDVNNALCDGTPWQCRTEVMAPGVCRQTFSRRTSL